MLLYHLDKIKTIWSKNTYSKMRCAINSQYFSSNYLLKRNSPGLSGHVFHWWKRPQCLICTASQHFLLHWSHLLHSSGTPQWRHDERDGISNHRRLHCLLKCWFRRRPKEISKLCVTGLCVGSSPVTDEFPAQRDSNAENVSIWWRHHEQSWCWTYLFGKYAAEHI